MYPPFTTPTITEPDADIETASQLRTVSRVDHVAPASELRKMSPAYWQAAMRMPSAEEVTEDQAVEASEPLGVTADHEVPLLLLRQMDPEAAEEATATSLVPSADEATACQPWADAPGVHVAPLLEEVYIRPNPSAATSFVPSEDEATASQLRTESRAVQVAPAFAEV